MKKIFIIRHGIYNTQTGMLLDTGVTQIAQSARKIKEILGDEKALVLYSNAPRTVESAHIILDFLVADSQECPLLCNTSGASEQQIYDACVSTGRDVLILVTHEEFSEILPCAICRKQGQKLTFFPKLACGAFHYLDFSK